MEPADDCLTCRRRIRHRFGFTCRRKTAEDAAIRKAAPDAGRHDHTGAMRPADAGYIAPRARGENRTATVPWRSATPIRSAPGWRRLLKTEKLMRGSRFANDEPHRCEEGRLSGGRSQRETNELPREHCHDPTTRLPYRPGMSLFAAALIGPTRPHGLTPGPI
jgi:hypothetical protein